MNNINEESIEMLLIIKKALLSDLMGLFVMVISGGTIYMCYTFFEKEFSFICVRIYFTVCYR